MVAIMGYAYLNQLEHNVHLADRNELLEEFLREQVLHITALEYEREVLLNL